jgi:mRNA interferase MazF
MKIKQFEVWIADLNPQLGTEPGKIRPVVVIQSNLLNAVHPSTLICPISINTKPGVNLLRVNLKAGMAGLEKDCSILIDQIRAIDNKRLIKKTGVLNNEISNALKGCILNILDIET